MRRPLTIRRRRGAGEMSLEASVEVVTAAKTTDKYDARDHAALGS